MSEIGHDGSLMVNDFDNASDEEVGADNGASNATQSIEDNDPSPITVPKNDDDENPIVRDNCATTQSAEVDITNNPYKTSKIKPGSSSTLEPDFHTDMKVPNLILKKTCRLFDIRGM